MKITINLFQVALVILFIILVACKSTKAFQGQAPNSKLVIETNKCEQTIRYYADKLKLITGGREINANTEIVINPSAKLISLISEPPNQEKVKFETVIENFDCNFNSDLTAGQAFYKGYIKQKDGTTTKSIIKVEAKDGALTISNADPEEEGELILLITKWEVVHE